MENTRKDYWENWLVKAEATLKEQEDKDGKSDFLQRSLFDVTKLAVENEQYDHPASETDVVKRVMRVNLKMSRDSIKKIFEQETYTIYGIGVYTVIEGYLLTPETRKLSGYDSKGKHSYFNEWVIPEEVRKNGKITLAVPALGGLFVPKRSVMIDWIWYRSQIQYFELDSDCLKIN